MKYLKNLNKFDKINLLKLMEEIIMKFDLSEDNFKEQAELMNMLNNYSMNNKNQNNQSMGFNVDTLYNIIEKDNNRIVKKI